MPDDFSVTNQPINPETKSKKGCLFYGCLTSLVIVLLLSVGLFFVGKKVVHKLVDEYTSTTPGTLPSVDASPQRVQEIQSKFTTFQQALSQNVGTPPLQLSSEDLNILMASSPQLKDIHKKVYFHLAGTQVKSQVSWPLDKIGFADRYVNGNGIFSVHHMDGRLIVYLESLEVNGKALPDDFMKEIKKENLAKDVTSEQNPEAKEFFNKLESIEIKDSYLFLYPKKVQI